MQSSSDFGAEAVAVYAKFDPSWMALLPKPTTADDKYSRGVVGFVTGSSRYPGAALLGVTAASRSGIGLIRLASDVVVTDLALQARPELVLAGSEIDSNQVPRVGSWVLGSGVAQDAEDQRERIHMVLKSADVATGKTPVVLDAAAASREFLHTGQTSLLTPHAGEAARLLEEFGIQASRAEIEADPASFAQKLAHLSNSTVILKGTRTVCAAPNEEILWQAQPAPASLATAGTGDVLAGLLGAILSKSPDSVFDAACLSVWLHSQAAFELDFSGHWSALDLAQQLAVTVSNAEDGRYVG